MSHKTGIGSRPKILDAATHRLQWNGRDRGHVQQPIQAPRTKLAGFPGTSHVSYAPRKD